MTSKDRPLALLLQPSPAFGGFLEYLIEEVGFRVVRFESIHEARLCFEEAQPDLVLICSWIVEDAKDAGLVDPDSTVILVGPSGHYWPGLKCIPKLFGPIQLRRAVQDLERAHT